MGKTAEWFIIIRNGNEVQALDWQTTYMKHTAGGRNTCFESNCAHETYLWPQVVRIGSPSKVQGGFATCNGAVLVRTILVEPGN